MSALTCSTRCREQHDHALQRELDRRWWVGITILAFSCAFAYGGHTFSPWLWGASAFAAWFGIYQTIYSKGCSSCGAEGDTRSSGPKVLDPTQRRTRRTMAHQLLTATVVLSGLSYGYLPLVWPLAAIVGWFTASFYVAAWKGYPGCPEIGAIPSWLSGHHIATRCAPLDKKDAQAASS